VAKGREEEKKRKKALNFIPYLQLCEEVFVVCGWQLGRKSTEKRREREKNARLLPCPLSRPRTEEKRGRRKGKKKKGIH